MLFIGFTAFCILITWVHYAARQLVVLTTKLSKIEDFIQLIGEVKFDSKRTKPDN